MTAIDPNCQETPLESLVGTKAPGRDTPWEIFATAVTAAPGLFPNHQKCTER